MTIISLILAVVAVVLYVIVKNELPASISEMVYKLPSGGWQWAWTIWLWVVLVLLTPQLIESLDDSYKVFGFLTIGCLALVAAMPLFERTDRKWHYVLAIVGGILSQVCVALICPWWLLLWFVMVYLVGKSFAAFNDSENIPEVLSGKGVFVAEAICMATVYGAVFIH